MIIGIDISKDKLDVHLLPQDKHYVVKNTPAGVAGLFRNQLKRNLKEANLELIVFEPTGGYEKALQIYLVENNLPYHRVHPSRIHELGKCKGYFAKTDHIDAKLLAFYGQQEDVCAQDDMNRFRIEIQELSSRRNQLKEMILAEKYRLSSEKLNKEINKSHKRIIKLLEKELQTMTDKLDKLIASEETLQHKRDLLKTVKGVGDELSSLLVTDLPELGQLSRESISLLVGVAPQTKESGQKKSQAKIKGGRFHIRRMLFMSALTAIRFNPRMKAFYEKLRAKGKLKKVCLVAVMRKLIVMMNAMVKHDTPWNKELA